MQLNLIDKALCHIQNFAKTHIWIFCNYLHFLLILYALRFYIFWNNLINVIIFWVIIKLLQGHNDKIAELIVSYEKVVSGAFLDFKDINFFLKYNYLLIEHCSRINIYECPINIRLLELHSENFKAIPNSAVNLDISTKVERPKRKAAKKLKINV